MKIAIASAKSSSDLMTATNQGHGCIRRILIESNAFTDDGEFSIKFFFFMETLILLIMSGLFYFYSRKN